MFLQLVIGIFVVYKSFNEAILKHSNEVFSFNDNLQSVKTPNDTWIQRENSLSHTHIPTFFPRCKKQRNVVFVKVHKTGSTTAWGIFARFAHNNGLNMVLPKRESGIQFNYLSSRNIKLSETILPPPRGETYNILCNHALYNKEQFDKLMPPDTVRIGIVRDPVSVVKSAFFYFGLYNVVKNRLPSTDSHMIFHKFLEHKIYQLYDLHRPLFNGMAYDFGIPTTQLSNTSFVLNYINILDRDFKLVIIAEYFDESLVLMKRYLCWDFQDILYLTQNKGTWRTYNRPNMTSDDINRITTLSKADSVLYNFFKVRLIGQIQREGPSFEHEVRHFKKVTQQLRQYCVTTESINSMTIPSTTWNKALHFDRGLCNRLITSEIELVRQLIRESKKKLSQRAQTTKMVK